MISFVGLGKLGLPLATCFAKRGIKVLAVDKNVSLIKKLNRKEVPWIEEGLDRNISDASEKINYTTSYKDINSTNTTIILVNTPSNKTDGSFSNVYVEQTIISICEALDPESNKGHHFILSSTVMPNTISKTLIPLIENILPWSLNKGDFGFSFVPDFVALGTIISDFENPDFLLVGSSSENYGKMAEDLYSNIIADNTPVSHLNIEEAELAKVSLNAFITTKISFANFLKLYAERSSANIDPTAVAMAIGQDKRIGRRYFRPGGPYGGTCFPRDTWAFSKASEEVGLKSEHMLANESVNNALVDDVLIKIIKSKLRAVVLLGAAFKTGTAVVTEGLAEKLAIMLGEYSFEVFLFELEDEIYNNFKVEGVQRIEKLTLSDDIFYVVCNEDYKLMLPEINNSIEAF